MKVFPFCNLSEKTFGSQEPQIRKKVSIMEFTVGQSYVCTPIGFKHTITGTILNVYENTVVMEVDAYDPAERTQVIEKQNRVIVSKAHLELCSSSAA
jgi:hypothetical protein